MYYGDGYGWASIPALESSVTATPRCPRHELKSPTTSSALPADYGAHRQFILLGLATTNTSANAQSPPWPTGPLECGGCPKKKILFYAVHCERRLSKAIDHRHGPHNHEDHPRLLPPPPPPACRHDTHTHTHTHSLSLSLSITHCACASQYRVRNPNCLGGKLTQQFPLALGSGGMSLARTRARACAG